MIKNPTHRASWRRRAKNWSDNSVAAKSRKRIDRGESVSEELVFEELKTLKLQYATVSIRCGKETVTFRVHRFDGKRLIMRGKVQAGSTIGKRLALALEAML